MPWTAQHAHTEGKITMEGFEDGFSDYPVDGFTVFTNRELPGWLGDDHVYLLVVRDGLTWAAEAMSTPDPLCYLDWHWGSVRLVHASDSAALPRWIEPDPVGLLAHLLPHLGLDV